MPLYQPLPLRAQMLARMLALLLYPPIATSIIYHPSMCILSIGGSLYVTAAYAAACIRSTRPYFWL